MPPKKWFSEIFAIVIPIVIQKGGATPQNSEEAAEPKGQDKEEAEDCLVS